MREAASVVLTTPSPSPALTRDRVIKVAETLPCAPRVLEELRVLLADPNSDLPQVSVLLRRDASLTARIIRVANGVIYNRGDPVGSLEDALARVGFQEIYRLTSTVAMLQMAELPLRFYPMTAQALRENSLLCALIMEELAGEVGLDSRTAYTTGLMRSVGRIILDITAQRDLRGRRPPPLGVEGVLGWESGFFGLTSPDTGGNVLRSWRFQADVFVAVRDQYLHNLPVDPLPLAKLLHLAIAESEAVGVALPGCAPYIVQQAQAVREALRLSTEVVEDSVRRAQFKFERMRAILG